MAVGIKPSPSKIEKSATFFSHNAYIRREENTMNTYNQYITEKHNTHRHLPFAEIYVNIVHASEVRCNTVQLDVSQRIKAYRVCC